MQIIPQREEGEIAFFSALASGEINPEEAVVWDIGTGSLQITTANTSEGLTVIWVKRCHQMHFDIGNHESTPHSRNSAS